MWEDEIVEEVRKVRKEIEEECDNDLRKIFARAIEVQKEYADKLVPAPLSLPKEKDLVGHTDRA
ncbi:MAG: hypothetical protein M3458_05740 [Acidobacteriota bacterium]|nr:hypothetical protein [Acidobacteriota bacterium]